MHRTILFSLNVRAFKDSQIFVVPSVAEELLYFIVLHTRAFELNCLLWGFLFLNMPFILEFFAILNVFFMWKSRRGESL